MSKHQTKTGHRHYEGDPVDIHVRFAPNTAGAVKDVRARGASVARTNTGEFTITLDMPFIALIDHKVDLRLSTPANVFAQLGDYDAAAKTIKVQLFKMVCTGAVSDATLTAVDVAYDANNTVSVSLVMGASKRDDES